jgi:UDP-N-acetylmuramate dehydrogenase
VDLTVQSGEPLDGLVRFAVAHLLTGIEYLVGIPGTTGAAPIQNTGAAPAASPRPLTLLTGRART